MIFFRVKGKEAVDRDVKTYPGTASRVFVPRKWKKVTVIRTE